MLDCDAWGEYVVDNPPHEDPAKCPECGYGEAACECFDCLQCHEPVTGAGDGCLVCGCCDNCCECEGATR